MDMPVHVSLADMALRLALTFAAGEGTVTG